MTIKELDRFKIQDYHLLWFFFPEDSSNSPIFYSLSPSALLSIAQEERARKITIILQPRRITLSTMRKLKVKRRKLVKKCTMQLLLTL